MNNVIKTVLGCVAIIVISMGYKYSDSTIESQTQCDHTPTKIQQLKNELAVRTHVNSGSEEGILPNQYLYFPDDLDGLVSDINASAGTVEIKQCPCNEMPMVLSNVYIEYEPKIRRGKEISEDEGGRFPIKNRLVLTEVSSGLRNGPQDVDITKFPNSSLKPHVKGKALVAIIDTGVDHKLFTTDEYLWTPELDAYQTTHASLQGLNVEGGINLFPNGAGLFDVDIKLEEIYSFPMDDEGHGTAVAAVVNNVAQEGFEYMIIKGLDSNGNSTLFDMICSIEYAYENGADYINTSWGFYGVEDAKTAIDEMQAFFEDKKRTPKIFASLGNKAINTSDLLHYPSEYSNSYPNIEDVSAAVGGMDRLSAMQESGEVEFANFSNFSCSDRSTIYPADGIILLNQVLFGTSFAAPQALAHQYLIDRQLEVALSAEVNDSYKLALLK